MRQVVLNLFVKEYFVLDDLISKVRRTLPGKLLKIVDKMGLIEVVEAVGQFSQVHRRIEHQRVFYLVEA